MNDLSLHLSVRYRSCPRPATSLSSDVYHRVRVAMFILSHVGTNLPFFSLRFAVLQCVFAVFRLRLFSMLYCPPSTGAAYM